MNTPVVTGWGGPARLLSAVTVAAGGAAGMFWLVELARQAQADAPAVIFFGAFTLMLAITSCYGWAMDLLWRRTHRQATDALSDFKEEFAARVSHELRTPLTGIVGYARLLDDDSLAGEDAEAVRAVISQSAELSRLIDDLVSSARLDAGLLEVERRPVWLLDEVNTVADFMRLLGTEVEVRCRDAQVLVDPECLRQMLRNLLVNAERHGGPSISVRGQTSGQNYVLQVVDNGPGLPQSLLDRDPFSRFNRSGDSPGGSVGLGLAMVRELAEVTDCQVDHRRLYGETHFIVTIPLAGPARLTMPSLDVDSLVATLPRLARSAGASITHVGGQGVGLVAKVGDEPSRNGLEPLDDHRRSMETPGTGHSPVDQERAHRVRVLGVKDERPVFLGKSGCPAGVDQEQRLPRTEETYWQRHLARCQAQSGKIHETPSLLVPIVGERVDDVFEGRDRDPGPGCDIGKGGGTEAP